MTIAERSQSLIRQAVKLFEFADIDFEESVRLFRYQLINGALTETKGNKSKAAKKLNMHRNTLMRYILDMQAREYPVVKPIERRPRVTNARRRSIVDWYRWKLYKDAGGKLQ